MGQLMLFQFDVNSTHQSKFTEISNFHSQEAYDILAEIKKNVQNYNVRQMKEITCHWEDKKIFHRILTFRKTVVIGLSGWQEQ